SLLVIDTGGWFRIGCPTSQIARPEINGGIYRIRRQRSAALADPRGLKIAWNALAPGDMTARLNDPRFAVRDRAVHELSKRGPNAVAAVERVVTGATSTRACRNAVWALARIDTAEARALLRRLLRDHEAGVRLSAAHALGLLRDQKALSDLMAM